MSERITKQQFANRATNLTYIAREAGAISATSYIGTAVAWSMSYVCVYDADGQMVRSLSQPMPTRGLFDYMGAMCDALLMVSRPTL